MLCTSPPLLSLCLVVVVLQELVHSLSENGIWRRSAELTCSFQLVRFGLTYLAAEHGHILLIPFRIASLLRFSDHPAHLTI